MRADLGPWLGRAAVAVPTPQPACRWVAETREERFWRRLLPGVFAPRRRPSALTRAINHVGVTPLASVTFLNLDYQIYLNQLLHTTAAAWLAHVILIPINVGLLFYGLAIVTEGLTIDGGLVLLVVLAAWYLAMAVRMRAWLWGLLSLALLGGLWLLASSCAELAIAVGLPWHLRPLTLIVATSLLQASSHLFEPNVPPRANFTDRWIPVREFLWGDRRVPLRRRLARLAWTPVGAVWGTFDEWLASAKLLPLYVLELLWMTGYQRERRAGLRQRSLAALASGDPALDWVGTGGGRSVVELRE